MESMIGGIMNVDHSKLRIDPKLEQPGFSPKFYLPVDSTKVLQLVFSADPRLQRVSPHLVLERSIIHVTAAGATKDEVAAMRDNARGLPGIISINFPKPELASLTIQ